MSDRTSKVVKGIITSVLQNGLSILFQLLITPMILLYAGQESLGAYAIIMQIIGYCILLDFGFSVALTRYLCQTFDYKNEISQFAKVLSTGRTFLLFTNFIIFILLIFVAWKVEVIIPGSKIMQNKAQTALLLMAIWMIVRTSMYVYNFALIATQDISIINTIAIFVNLIRLLCAVFFTYIGQGFLGLIIANVVAELLQFIIQKFYFNKRYKHIFLNWHLTSISLGSEIFKFGIGYWGVNLSVVLLLGSDNLIAGFIFGSATASIFYSSKMLGSLAVQFISKIIETIYPALNELIGKNKIETVRTVYLRSLRYVLLLTIPATFGIIIFSKGLIANWVGLRQYAGDVMPVTLSLFVFLQIFSHLHGITVLALGKISNWTLISIISGIISVIMGFLCGKYIGMQWIMLGMSVGMIPILIFLFKRVIFCLNIKMTTILNEVVIPAFLACLPIGIILVLNYLIIFPLTLSAIILTLIFYSFLWIIGVWIFGIHQTERMQVISLFLKTFKSN